MRDSTPLSEEKILITKLVTKKKLKRGLNENELVVVDSITYCDIDIQVVMQCVSFFIIRSDYS